MAVMAEIYTSQNDGFYPLTEDVNVQHGDEMYKYVWDFTTIENKSDGSERYEPGILWQGKGLLEIQQCPSFKGSANWGNDPYTGYNYNASYIGGRYYKDPWTGKEYFIASAKSCQVKAPFDCALFGDGEYKNGANKMMRSPFAGILDPDFSASGRWAGTQGYRHLETTNVAYCDGSARNVRQFYTETDKWGRPNIAEGTGFLSPDNSAYDLE